jgi:tripartite-type tricarboxylate transporter receptor subunit TctC
LSWSGLSAPKGTPPAIIAKLEAAMAQAMGSAAIKARMEGNGFVVPPQGSKVYADFVGKEVDRWTNVIKTAGIKTQ